MKNKLVLESDKQVVKGLISVIEADFMLKKSIHWINDNKDVKTGFYWYKEACKLLQEIEICIEQNDYLSQPFALYIMLDDIKNNHKTALKLIMGVN